VKQIPKNLLQLLSAAYLEEKNRGKSLLAGIKK
jgi:hypothetical protein